MKHDLKKLALLGLSSGVFLANTIDAAEKQSPPQKNESYDPNDGNMNYHLMSEEEFLLELNDQGLKMYQSLDSNGKALAIKVASGMCGKTNQCKGLNACKTDKNECAGKGSCKGQGICAVSDKNLAVKLVYDKMKEKREKTLENSNEK